MSEVVAHLGALGGATGDSTELDAELALMGRLRAQTWRREAACRGVDPELFFPGRGDPEGLARAKAVCETCPVREHCAEDGMGERFGVWGGLSDHQRRRMRRRR